MQRSKKLCYGLLSAFFTIFGLSLSVCSDTNALKYPINSIPIGPDLYQFRKLTDFQTGDEFYIAFVKRQNFDITSTINTGFPDGFQYPETWTFTGDYDFSTNTCRLPDLIEGNGNYYSSGWWPLRGDYDISYQYRLPDILGQNPMLDGNDIFNPESSPFDFSKPLSQQGQWVVDNQKLLCSMRNHAFTGWDSEAPPATANYPKWNWASLINIPLVNNRLQYEASKPYTYQYDVIRINSSEKGDDGMVYEKNGIKMSEIFNVKIPTFSYLGFNLSEFTESSSWLSPEDSDDSTTTEDVYSFTVMGSIEFDSEYTLGSDAGIDMHIENYYNPYADFSDYNFEGSSYFHNPLNGHIVRYIPYSGEYRQGTQRNIDIHCDMTEYHINQGDDSNRLDYSCHYNPIQANAFSEKINFRYLNIMMQFMGDSINYNSEAFLQTDGDYTFKDMYIVTNENYTPSGWSGSLSGSGGDTASAPGDYWGDGGGLPDFNQSLISLFNFEFFNPFAPIFNLFTDQNACASIPTLASMINSEETTVCPWFDSTTRNIVTPVLGLASAMLIFGFAVRWLGSSSGNLFEDSTNETLANVNNSGFRRYKK